MGWGRWGGGQTIVLYNFDRIIGGGVKVAIKIIRWGRTCPRPVFLRLRFITVLKRKTCFKTETVIPYNKNGIS